MRSSALYNMVSPFSPSPRKPLRVRVVLLQPSSVLLLLVPLLAWLLGVDALMTMKTASYRRPSLAFTERRPRRLFSTTTTTSTTSLASSSSMSSSSQGGDASSAISTTLPLPQQQQQQQRKRPFPPVTVIKTTPPPRTASTFSSTRTSSAAAAATEVSKNAAAVAAAAAEVDWDWQPIAAAAFDNDDAGTTKDTRPILLFDGVCNFCNDAVNACLDLDIPTSSDSCSTGGGTLRFASLHSRVGQALLIRSGKSPYHHDSIVLVTPETAYFHSDAVLYVLQRLPGLPLPIRVAARIIRNTVPTWLRDATLKIVSERRHLLGGQVANGPTCRLDLDGEYQGRFLD
jgi:predicted DCC family thiol-disulfide oxidoreductase YuxK